MLGFSQAAFAAEVTKYRVRNERAILAELVSLLSLPNDASNIPDMERNADFITKMIEKRGFTAKRLTAGPGTPPAVFGELRSPGAKRTIIFYAHFDGQPAPSAGWLSPPWQPVIRDGPPGPGAKMIDWRNVTGPLNPDWRLYARSASDDKSPIVALLTALDALRSTGRKPSVNIKLLFEGEEEKGSPHLAQILATNRKLLSADLLIMCDGPVHQTGAMQLFFGARGATGLEMTVFGPRRPLHSGHYGNWAPNPGVMIARLVASMRDEEGKILIPGFYDDVKPLTPADRAALAALPDVETQLRSELALGRTEGEERLMDSVSRPALNIRGISVGDVGLSAANVISPLARASIDFRLAPGQTPKGVRDRIEAFLKSQGWRVVHADPTSAELTANPRTLKLEWALAYPASKTDIDIPASQAVIAAIEQGLGRRPILIPMLGGSVPIHVFSDALQVPVVGVPIVNYDNNQHGPNENLRLGHLWDGIEIYTSLLTLGW